MNTNAPRAGGRARQLDTRLTAVALAVSLAFPASAATLSWTGDVDTALATAGNWSGLVGPAANDTLSFAALASGTYPTLANNVADALHSLVFYGGGYTLAGGDIKLTPTNVAGWVDTNVLSVYGGSHTIDSASITLQPLVINRTVSQEVINNFNISMRGGGVLNLNAPINVGGFTPIPQLPYKDNVPPSPAAIQLSVYEGSTLNLKGAVNNASGRLIINNWGSSVAVSGALNVSELSLLGKGNQTTLRDNGAVVWGGAGKSISLRDDLRLALDNSGNALNDRLGGADITVEPAATLELTGNAAGSVREQAGRLSINGIGKVNSPDSVIRVNANGQSTVLSFSELAFGSGTYQSGGHVDFQTNGSFGGNARILFTQAPASTDGLVNRATVNGNEFAAYDGALSGGVARGVVAATTRNTLAGATSTDNVFLNGANETVTGTVNVNSLASRDATVQGAGQTLAVGSGQVLLNGTNSLAPALNFAGREGRINVRSGQTVLQGGLQGSNGALVSGTGNLVISGVSSLAGTLRVDSPTLTLATDNVLQGTNLTLKSATIVDPAKATLDIGTTTQTVASLSGGSVSGTGSLVATVGGISTSGNIAARLQADNGNVNLSYGTVSGNVSAKQVSLTGSTIVSSVSANTGIAVHDVAVDGDGLLNAPSVNVQRNLFVRYMTAQGGATQNRIGDAAAINLNNGNLDLLEQGTPSSQTVEKIGALSIAGKSSLNLSGNVNLLADRLTVAAGARLNVKLGDSGTVKFVTSPVTVDGAVVEGVLVDHKVTTATVTNGVVPVWATYSASNGLQTEHAIGTLASAGTGVVRVVANQPVNSAISVGGAVLDTASEITGGGTLSTAKGLVFFQDNTVSIANVVMGANSLLANAGTNTIASNMSGSSLEKLGQGSIELSGTSTFSQGVAINEGGLVVSGTLNASVTGGGLVIKGPAGKVNGNLDSVTLEQASFTNANGRRVGSVYVTAGSSFTNDAIAGQIDVGGGKATNNGTVEHLHVYGGAGTTNAGTIRQHLDVGAGTVTNSGKVQADVGQSKATVDVGSNAKLVNQAGGSVSVLNVSNSGEISNAGTFELLASGRYSGTGKYEQTGGLTTVDGVFEGDMLLNGGTLNGWGVITGTVTAMAGAKILPGHSPGIMEIESLVLESGSVLELDVSTTGQSDNLVIRGVLDARAGSKIKFNILDTTEVSALDVDNYFTLSQSNLSWSGVSFLASTSTGDAYALDLNADGSIASVTSVPEPETYAMMLAGLGLVGGWVRRQRKAMAA